MKYEETIDALNKMIDSLKCDIEDNKFGTKRPLPPIYWLMADYYRLKGVLELLQKQNEILQILKPLMEICRVTQDYTEAICMRWLEEYNENYKTIKDWLEEK